MVPASSGIQPAGILSAETPPEFFRRTCDMETLHERTTLTQSNGDDVRSTVKDCVLDGFKAALTYKVSGNDAVFRYGSQFTIEMIEQHAIIDQFIASLQDAESKEVIAWLIRFRAALSIIGDKDVVLDKFFPSRISKSEYAQLTQKASALPEAKLKSAIIVDLIENFLLGGYSISGICEVEAGDVVLDLGAFNGNSTIDLARRAGRSGQIIAFEPNGNIAVVARENLVKMGVSAEIVNSAVGEEEGELRFKKGGAASRIDPNGDIIVPVQTVDRFLAKRGIDRIDFLKLDIEGHEVQALKGAAETIRNSRPKIAVCIYHLATDLTLIPALISDYYPDYRFYVRHRARHDGEVVLFCVPQ